MLKIEIMEHKMNKLTVLGAALLGIPQGRLLNRERMRNFWDEMALVLCPDKYA
jgi:hypothetical protein